MMLKLDRRYVKFKILYLLPVLAVLGYAASGYISNSTVLPYNYSPEKYRAALESGKHTVLELGADWCQVCIRMMPIMGELKAEYPDVNFIIANIDVEKKLIAEHGVLGTPTFIFFDSRGEKVRSIIGYREKETMKNLVEGMLSQQVQSSSPFEELIISGAYQREDKIYFWLSLKESRFVRVATLAAFLDGKPLKILETEPDIISSDRELVFISNRSSVKVVAESQAKGKLLEAQVTIEDEECCGGIRDIYNYVDLR